MADPIAEQYCDAGNLNARMALHRRFSINPHPWHRWVFDRLLESPHRRLLEVGCGPGRLWRENRDRIPASWEIVPTDSSPGMIEDARRDDPGDRFALSAADVQSLPFRDSCFDAVVANHMLYHVVDRRRALAEIRRVLAPGGRLYAATNGEGHMRELFDLVEAVAGPGARPGAASSVFTLENGASQLAAWFNRVTLLRFEDGLLVTEPEPLLSYVLSGFTAARVRSSIPELRDRIERILRDHGAVRIGKSAGLFVAEA